MTAPHVPHQKHDSLALSLIISGIGAVFLIGVTAWLSSVDTAIAESRNDMRSLDRRVTVVESDLRYIREGQAEIRAKQDRIGEGQERQEELLQQILRQTSSRPSVAADQR